MEEGEVGGFGETGPENAIIDHGEVQRRYEVEILPGYRLVVSAVTVPLGWWLGRGGGNIGGVAHNAVEGVDLGNRPVGELHRGEVSQ